MVFYRISHPGPKRCLDLFISENLKAVGKKGNIWTLGKEEILFDKLY